MDERKVRDERTGWRDSELGTWHSGHGFAYSVADPNDLDLNNRHRMWGYDCPAVDIDQLFLEYDKCLPVAVHDYKLRTRLDSPEPNRNAANYLAISRLCREVPFYATYYTKHPWTFRPIPINTQARHLAPRKPFLTESEFVQWLYWLRDRIANSTILKYLDKEASWEALSSADRPKKQKRQKSKLPVPTLFDQNPVMQTAMWEAPV